MQLTENFIGRAEELSQFMHWLEDDNGSLIFYLHDALGDPAQKGGIGKTWLLRRFVSLIEEQKELRKRFIPVFVDFFNVADRDGVVIAERVVQALHDVYKHWSSDNFERILHQYHETLLPQKIDSVGILSHLSNALSYDLHTLREFMAQANTSLLLIFDTFELIENSPIMSVLHTSHLFPETYNFDRIRVVIAGRNALDMRHQNWIGREHDITSVPLSPFTYEETMQYLDYYDSYICKDTPEELLQTLYERTEGRPILLGLVIDVLSGPGKSLEELVRTPQAYFEESLVAQINDFDEPIKWITFFMAHVYHRFNLAFLDLIMNTPGLDQYIPKVGYQELIERLPALSFMRRSSSSNDFVLHDEMRRLVNKYCWEKQDPGEDLRRELSKIAVSYYKQILEHEQHEGMRQSYIVELLSHSLVINKDEGFKFFKEHFDRVLKFSLRTFARSLFQEAQTFRGRFSVEQLYILQMSEAILLREEENYADALAIYKVLEQDSERAELYRSDILYEKGPCYLRLGRYYEAINCFSEDMEIEQTNPDKSRYAALLSRLGYIHRLQGHYKEAIVFYQKALNVQRNLDNPQEYADLLNNIGNALRLQGGRSEEALRFCKLALRIRRDLFKQNIEGEASIALSQNTLGHIYHTLGVLDEEEKAYREAFEIYCRLGDRSSLAHTHNNIGRMLVHKGDLQAALAEFKEAMRIAAGENHVAEIESYNQQGRLALKQAKWEEARRFFAYATELSQQIHLRFSLAENLLYLAETLDYLAQSSDALIKRAKRIARENNYNYLLALAGDIQGDIDFRKEQYQSAFKQYRISCRYMAQRGSPEFDRTLRKINDQLLAVPTDFLPGIMDSLLSYWYELGLEEKYPQLLRLCQEISRNMLF